MKTLKFLLMTVVLVVTGHVSAAPTSAPNVPRAGAYNPGAVDGIITPDVADGFIRTSNFLRFEGTGKLAVCMKTDGDCAGKEWKTPEEAVAKRFPKAKYVGFKVLRYQQSDLEVLLFYRSGQ